MQCLKEDGISTLLRNKENFDEGVGPAGKVLALIVVNLHHIRSLEHC